LTGDLVRVVAPHFVAGIIVRDGKCVTAAPILRWAIGKTRDELRAYFASKRWDARIIAANAKNPPPHEG
jgi:hypothetical protein